MDVVDERDERPSVDSFEIVEFEDIDGERLGMSSDRRVSMISRCGFSTDCRTEKLTCTGS